MFCAKLKLVPFPLIHVLPPSVEYSQVESLSNPVTLIKVSLVSKSLLELPVSVFKEREIISSIKSFEKLAETEEEIELALEFVDETSTLKSSSLIKSLPLTLTCQLPSARTFVVYVVPLINKRTVSLTEMSPPIAVPLIVIKEEDSVMLIILSSVIVFMKTVPAIASLETGSLESTKEELVLLFTIESEISSSF